MRIKLSSGVISLALLIIPVTSLAAINSSITSNGTYSTGTNAQFNIHLSNYQSSNAIDILTVANSSVKDIKSISYLNNSAWVNLTRLQSGTDVIARFSPNGGVSSAGIQTVLVQINFQTPKSYIVGFSLQTNDGKTISSAAVPVVITGAKVLGASTTATGTFTRRLTVGSTGADVTALQTKLTALGLFNGPISGYFGRLTQAAVKAYQTSHGISPVNGVVGPLTQASLNQ